MSSVKMRSYWSELCTQYDWWPHEKRLGNRDTTTCEHRGTEGRQWCDDESGDQRFIVVVSPGVSSCGESMARWPMDSRTAREHVSIASLAVGDALRRQPWEGAQTLWFCFAAEGAVSERWAPWSREWGEASVPQTRNLGAQLSLGQNRSQVSRTLRLSWAQMSFLWPSWIWFLLLLIIYQKFKVVSFKYDLGWQGFLVILCEFSQNSSYLEPSPYSYISVLICSPCVAVHT